MLQERLFLSDQVQRAVSHDRGKFSLLSLLFGGSGVCGHHWWLLKTWIIGVLVLQPPEAIPRPASPAHTGETRSFQSSFASLRNQISPGKSRRATLWDWSNAYKMSSKRRETHQCGWGYRAGFQMVDWLLWVFLEEKKMGYFRCFRCSAFLLMCQHTHEYGHQSQPWLFFSAFLHFSGWARVFHWAWRLSTNLNKVTSKF